MRETFLIKKLAFDLGWLHKIHLRMSYVTFIMIDDLTNGEIAKMMTWTVSVGKSCFKFIKIYETLREFPLLK